MPFPFNPRFLSEIRVWGEREEKLVVMGEKEVKWERDGGGERERYEKASENKQWGKKV